MGLSLMDAVTKRLFPNKPHRIKPQPLDPITTKKIEQASEPQQHFRLTPIHIHLIGPERGPDRFWAPICRQGGE